MNPIANSAPAGAVAPAPRCTNEPPKCAPTSLVGAVAVVDVCATWTNPCRPQMPVLADVARRYPNVRVIVLLDDDVSPADAAAWQAKVGAPNVTLLDKDSPYLAYSFAVQNLPTTFVYDASGAQVASWVGLVTADKLTTVIEAALH